MYLSFHCYTTVDQLPEGGNKAQALDVEYFVEPWSYPVRLTTPVISSVNPLKRVVSFLGRGQTAKNR